jgi:hypothetical protein
MSELLNGQVIFGFVSSQLDPIKVQISQFYGIEINDFAVSVAKTALWIAESQMMKATEEIVHMSLDFLPLRSYANIIEGNALRLDWENVAPKEKLDYIMGNPPFNGARTMNPSQKEDIHHVFRDMKGVGNLDYVTGWYKKATDLMVGSRARAAFVSTNSITQGEQVSILWKPLMERGIYINYGVTTFKWSNEAKNMAAVHCVIIGFSLHKTEPNINPYLIQASTVFVENRSTPLFDVPIFGIGNKPIDGGNYLFTEDEMRAFVAKEPESAKWFRKWIGADEFINGYYRYFLFLRNCPPTELLKMPECMKRVDAVRKQRLASKSAGTRKIAQTPLRFHVENIPESTYIVIPEVSSENRKYIPIGFVSADVLASNRVKIATNATLYHFGILTSNVHMAWTRVVCGRLKSDYSYSIGIVYNNFPWPSPTDAQHARIEQTAQAILDARARYPDCSLADLYSERMWLYPELLTAHQNNDRAVMQAYGFSIKGMTESACVAELMRLYQAKAAEHTRKE